MVATLEGKAFQHVVFLFGSFNIQWDLNIILLFEIYILFLKNKIQFTYITANKIFNLPCTYSYE